MTRALFLSLVLFAFIGGIGFLACLSGSETPNAYFNHDGGPGDLGELCRSSNLCNDPLLVCVDEDGDQGPSAPVCRSACKTTDVDPCGAGFVCVAIRDQGDNGACLPGPGDGEACTGRCDDGLVCAGSVDGGSGICHTECTPTGPACPNSQTCNANGFCE